MKIFNTSRITKSQLRQVVCKSAKEMGVSKVIFNSTAKHVSGSYNAEKNVMFLDTKLTKKELLDTFFHELGHHVAVKQNKWRGYHYDLNPNITKEEIFKIENKIELTPEEENLNQLILSKYSTGVQNKKVPVVLTDALAVNIKPDNMSLQEFKDSFKDENSKEKQESSETPQQRIERLKKAKGLK